MHSLSLWLLFYAVQRKKNTTTFHLQLYYDTRKRRAMYYRCLTLTLNDFIWFNLFYIFVHTKHTRAYTSRCLWMRFKGECGRALCISILPFSCSFSGSISLSSPLSHSYFFFSDCRRIGKLSSFHMQYVVWIWKCGRNFFSFSFSFFFCLDGMKCKSCVAMRIILMVYFLVLAAKNSILIKENVNIWLRRGVMWKQRHE